jgi:hypothetical protein|tara:strand:+ start:880 stop:1110 length:231 start_codon:yes stop_codon:yes gene_type:complete
MKSKVKMQRAFEIAVARPENFDSEGAIIWNFIDADVYEVMVKGRKMLNQNESVLYMEEFDRLADLYEASPVNLEAV